VPPSSGQFNANGAWTVLGAIAHNLLRWTQLIGLPDSTIRAARTLRRRWLQIAGGRLTRHGRTWTLHLPARWPWQATISTRSTETARSPPLESRRRGLIKDEQSCPAFGVGHFCSKTAPSPGRQRSPSRHPPADHCTHRSHDRSERNPPNHTINRWIRVKACPEPVAWSDFSSFSGHIRDIITFI
jgi:hypothetical protein